MTHEELLAEINERIEELHNAEVCDGFIHALRAVVELCKPNGNDTYKMISSLEILEAIEKELQ